MTAERPTPGVGQRSLLSDEEVREEELLDSRTTVVCATVPVRLKLELERIAEDQRCSLSQVIRGALEADAAHWRC